MREVEWLEQCGAWVNAWSQWRAQGRIVNQAEGESRLTCGRFGVSSCSVFSSDKVRMYGPNPISVQPSMIGVDESASVWRKISVFFDACIRNCSHRASLFSLVYLQSTPSGTEHESKTYLPPAQNNQTPLAPTEHHAPSDPRREQHTPLQVLHV